MLFTFTKHTRLEREMNSVKGSRKKEPCPQREPCLQRLIGIAMTLENLVWYRPGNLITHSLKLSSGPISLSYLAFSYTDFYKLKCVNNKIPLTTMERLKMLPSKPVVEIPILL